MTPRAAKPKPNSDAFAEAAFSFAPQVGLLGAFGPLLVTQTAQGALTALDAFESTLQMWRDAIDGSRMALRDQQDSIAIAGASASADSTSARTSLKTMRPSDLW